MRRAWIAGGLSVALTVVFVWTMVPPSAMAADAPVLVDARGNPVAWAEWLSEHGPAAVLVWASWAPDAGAAIDSLEALRSESSRQQLKLVVVDVQEPIEAARVGLGRRVEWLHDRHGAILKLHRVIEVPAIVVIDADGTVLARLDPTPGALAGWRR